MLAKLGLFKVDGQGGSRMLHCLGGCILQPIRQVLRARQHVFGVGNQIKACAYKYSLEKLSAVRVLHGAANDAQKAKQKEQIYAQRSLLTESSSAADKESHVAVRSSQAHCKIREHRLPSWITFLFRHFLAVCKLSCMSCCKAMCHS